jgi:hypothetical protein
VGAGALGDLVLVVGEDEVLAAAVDVEGLAEVLPLMAEHSMCQPGRPRPHGLSQPGSSSGRLPQHEVPRVRLYGATSTRAPAIRSPRLRCRTARRSRAWRARRTARGPRRRRRGRCSIRRRSSRSSRRCARWPSAPPCPRDRRRREARRDHRDVDALFPRRLVDLVVDVRDVRGPAARRSANAVSALTAGRSASASGSPSVGGSRIGAAASGTSS